MKVQFIIQPEKVEPEAVIYTAEITEEVRQAERLLSGTVLNGYSGNTVTRLPSAEIIRIYGESQKVYAQTSYGIFLLRQRLYELEDLLPPPQFLRISGSELVNSACIEHLDISVTGTIGMTLSHGILTYVSRRHVKDIRTLLDL